MRCVLSCQSVTRGQVGALYALLSVSQAGQVGGGLRGTGSSPHALFLRVQDGSDSALQ